MLNKIFFKFLNFNFRKKKKKREMKKRKKGKKGRAYFVITLLFMSPTTQHIFYLCSDREISDMILIIKNNISSYN